MTYICKKIIKSITKETVLFNDLFSIKSYKGEASHSLILPKKH